MYLRNNCEKKNKNQPEYIMGDSRCPKHGLRSFDTEPLVIYCSSCAEKAQRCQICGCYVNAREYNARNLALLKESDPDLFFITTRKK
jgi:hypothetical protein